MKIASFQVDSHDMIFDNFAAIIIRHFAVSPNFVYKMLVIESAGSRNFFLPQVYFTMPGIALVMGPSPGIGKAIAYRLSRDTFNLVIHDIPSQKAHITEVQVFITQQGGMAITVLGDVSKESDVRQMVDDVVKRLGGIDAVSLLSHSHPPYCRPGPDI